MIHLQHFFSFKILLVIFYFFIIPAGIRLLQLPLLIGVQVIFFFNGPLDGILPFLQLDFSQLFLRIGSFLGSATGYFHHPLQILLLLGQQPVVVLLFGLEFTILSFGIDTGDFRLRLFIQDLFSFQGGASLLLGFLLIDRRSTALLRCISGHGHFRQFVGRFPGHPAGILVFNLGQLAVHVIDTLNVVCHVFTEAFGDGVLSQVLRLNGVPCLTEGILPLLPGRIKFSCNLLYFVDGDRSQLVTSKALHQILTHAFNHFDLRLGRLTGYVSDFLVLVFHGQLGDQRSVDALVGLIDFIEVTFLCQQVGQVGAVFVVNLLDDVPPLLRTFSRPLQGSEQRIQRMLLADQFAVHA